MTTYTRTAIKDGVADVAVHKVEEELEMEDVDVARRIWEGAAIVTRMEIARISEAISGHQNQTIATMPRLRIWWKGASCAVIG